MKKSVVPHFEFRFSSTPLGLLTIEREIRSDFERNFLGRIVRESNAAFKPLWDRSKLESIQTNMPDIRRKNWYPNKRQACGVQYRNYRSVTRFVGLSRYVFKRMFEKGVLPGMYRTG